VQRLGGRLVELPGSREQVPLDAGALVALTGDVHRRDAYVCGPEPFTASLAASLREAGMPPDRIHYESFTF
jgi:ferredoxin-NADP reductase